MLCIGVYKTIYILNRKKGLQHKNDYCFNIKMYMVLWNIYIFAELYIFFNKDSEFLINLQYIHKQNPATMQCVWEIVNRYTRTEKSFLNFVKSNWSQIGIYYFPFGSKSIGKCPIQSDFSMAEHYSEKMRTLCVLQKTWMGVPWT